MSAVTVTGLSKRYDRSAALDNVSIEFQDGEFFALLGPSGSGKTTLLRCIAGFVQADTGRILFAGQQVDQIPVHKRDIGMVFQDYALFPHLTVFDNVAFGLSVRGKSKREIRQRVDDMLALVQLDGLQKRKPRQLSGGQQQRVALARALITRPQVLLLDEPLGALDKRLRQEMQIELKQIQQELALTTLFVTHDQEEALTLSDRVAIIDQGRVVQIGAPAEVYEHPNSAFTAEFLGDANFFSAQVITAGQLRSDQQLDLFTSDPLPPTGAWVKLAVRPEKIHLLRDHPQACDLPNRIPGQIAQIVYSGTSITYFIATEHGQLEAFEQNQAAQLMDLGTPVTALWAAEHLVVIESPS